MWQEVAVVIVEVLAVAFLVRKLFPGKPRRARGATSFVPLASLRKPRSGGDSSCCGSG